MAKGTGKVCVVRLGHRTGRDQRITTHVFLAARALGASEGVLCGDEDGKIASGVGKVSELWGGRFRVKYEKDWKKFVRKRKERGWKVVHLTMYGENFEACIGRIMKENCIVIVGAGKVPREAYELADFNLSVTNQPHSEIAAIALFLDRFYGGKGIEREFGGMLKIVPDKCGKIVLHGKRRCRHI